MSLVVSKPAAVAEILYRKTSDGQFIVVTEAIPAASTSPVKSEASAAVHKKSAAKLSATLEL